jgi:hypothetical protein
MAQILAIGGAGLVGSVRFHRFRQESLYFGIAVGLLTLEALARVFSEIYAFCGLAPANRAVLPTLPLKHSRFILLQNVISS